VALGSTLGTTAFAKNVVENACLNDDLTLRETPTHPFDPDIWKLECHLHCAFKWGGLWRYDSLQQMTIDPATNLMYAECFCDYACGKGQTNDECRSNSDCENDQVQQLVCRPSTNPATAKYAQTCQPKLVADFVDGNPPIIGAPPYGTCGEYSFMVDSYGYSMADMASVWGVDCNIYGDDPGIGGGSGGSSGGGGGGGGSSLGQVGDACFSLTDCEIGLICAVDNTCERSELQ
jgi:hypothetical protein